MKAKLEGVVPVIPVPFLEDDSIDEPSLRKAVEFVATRKMKAFCLPAYGSEFYKLTDAEREQVVRIAIDQAADRALFVAQANHPSARVAAELAQHYEQLGAHVISVALPRQFAVTEQDLLAYCAKIAAAVSCPLLIQDFNPGGPTVGAEFIATLHRAHANIAYFKLEEPMIMDKLAQVRDSLGEQVGILGGWGGYYMLESMSVGICGIMPGVPICDLLQRVFDAFQKGDRQQAYDRFSSLLPYIAFTLQNFEMFLQIEKRLMVRRGLFRSARCRALTRTLSHCVSDHIDFLLDQIIAILAREQLDYEGD